MTKEAQDNRPAPDDNLDNDNVDNTPTTNAPAANANRNATAFKKSKNVFDFRKKVKQTG